MGGVVVAVSLISPLCLFLLRPVLQAGLFSTRAAGCWGRGAARWCCRNLGPRLFGNKLDTRHLGGSMREMFLTVTCRVLLGYLSYYLTITFAPHSRHALIRMLWVAVAHPPTAADGLGEEGGSGTWPFILISVSPAVTLLRATPEHCASPQLRAPWCRATLRPGEHPAPAD